MTRNDEQMSDIAAELEMISQKKSGSFGELPRSLSAMEKAAAEIKRLRLENNLLLQEVERLKVQGQ